MILRNFLIGGCVLSLTIFSAKYTSYGAVKKNNSKSCFVEGLLPPPPIVKGNNPTLYVGLASHLGLKEENKNTLFLTSKHKKSLLKLTDAKGFTFESSEITISWESFPISSSRIISKQIIGPYASFESAQNVASRLHSKGICAFIANPKDWEVWLPADTQIPRNLNLRTLVLNEIIKNQLKPVLITPSNKFILSGPVLINSLDGIAWNQGIYAGPFLLQPDSYGTWTLVEKVSLENYLHGVVPYEIGSTAPKDALAAQAVLARTWALANVKRYSIDGYHLCSTTQCQVYKNPQQISKSVKNSISKTSGKVLSFNNQPIQAFYHATNGGIMARGEEAWSMKPLPYLKVKIDSTEEMKKKYKIPMNVKQLNTFLDDREGFYGINHKRFRWTRVLSSRQIRKYFSASEKFLDLPKEINILSRGPSGRVLALEIKGENEGSRTVLELDAIRKTLPSLPSTLFIVKKLEDGVWQFEGGGFGHGVGLSQAGAVDLALEGWSTEEILSHYYPGTSYGPLPQNWIAP